MLVRLLDNGRELDGTAVEIVRKMKEGAFGGDDIKLGEFVDQVCERLKRLRGIDLKIVGRTGEEKAEKLVESMVEAGLAEHVK